jgi:HEAT repeat protein
VGFASRALHIRSGEGRTAGLLVGLMFVSNAAITIGQSGVDALFFDRIGADGLPLMYLLQGGSTVVGMLVITGVLGRLQPRRAYLTAPLVLAAIVVAERAVLAGSGNWIYRLLWITVALAILIQGIVTWGIAGSVVDTRQAKRLFPIFAGGYILGAVAGGLVTRPLAPAIGAQNLLLVWAGGFVVVFALARVALGRRTSIARRRIARRRPSALRDMAQGFAFVRRSSLLMWMTAASILFSVLFFLLYLPYARAAAEHFRDADELAAFFGLFWASVTGTAFLVSTFVTNRFFAFFGVAAMVVVLPIMYGVGFGVLTVASGFATLVILRFAIGAWLQSVASPAWETLTNVVPESRRDQTRAFLSGGPAQVGTAIAGVIALVGEDVLDPRSLGFVGLVVAGVTIITAIGIRRSFAGALMMALQAGRPQVFERSSSPGADSSRTIDADRIRALILSLRSPDVRVRRLAYQLLADLPPHARPSVVIGGVHDADEIIRVAGVRALDPDADVEHDFLLKMVGDPDPAVAATAAARALALPDEPSSEFRIRQLLADPDARVRRIALEQLGFAPAQQAARFAEDLLADDSAEVRTAALDRLAAAAPERYLETAAAHLHNVDPGVRIAAGRLLGAIGDPALELLLAALEAPETADAAVQGVRQLHGIQDVDRVRTFIQSATKRATDDRDLAFANPRDRVETTLLFDALLERGRSAARSALWAMTLLIEERQPVETAIENLDGSSRQVANALETLESAGDRIVVRPLLSLWEPPSSPPSKGESWLARAVEDPQPFIRQCAQLIRAQQGGAMSESTTTVSRIERVLLLLQVPLFAELTPFDLERAAQVAEERSYADDDVIAAEGDVGDELHIVVDGIVRVIQDRDGSEVEIARRSTGDVIAEMSIITQEPRIASLMADGAVRTIRIGHREFESMLRERPRMAVAVMRVLAHRLAEGSQLASNDGSR